MKIRFSEHSTLSYLEGCLSELEEMGATIEQPHEDWYGISVLRNSRDRFVIEFLRNEERKGMLDLIDSED